MSSLLFRPGLLLVLLMLLAACSSPGPTDTPAIPPTSTPQPGDSLVLAYDGWAGSYLPTYVLKAIFEDSLGYDVQVSDQTTIPAAFESVAAGRTDIFTSAWFPLRDSTLDKYPNLVKLGQIYGGKDRDAYEGWMVPIGLSEQYGVTQVKDLKKQAVVSALDTDGDGRGNLIGCPPDWVCAGRHAEILSDNNLSDLYEIDVPQTEDDLLAAVAERFQQGQAALFYMLQPVGFPGGFQVTERALWLSGTEQYLPLSFNRVVVKGDFLAFHPAAGKILNRVKIPGEDISQAMEQIKAAGAQGTQPGFLRELARNWITNNRAEVDSWLQGVSRRISPAPPGSSGNAVTVAYSPEKEDLFLKLVLDFNLRRPADVLPVLPLRQDMPDMLRNAVDGNLVAISPDSSIWYDELNRNWEARQPAASALVTSNTPFATSPLVIAMRESRAGELGYLDAPIGWKDLAAQAASGPRFNWAHSSGTTASGLLTTVAEVYEGVGKLENLTSDDLQAKGTIAFLKEIEGSVERYEGETEDRVIVRMLAEANNPLDAFTVQEQQVIFFNRNSEDEKLVALYPKNGTFTLDHTLALLNGSWVSEPEQETYRKFASFVLETPQQLLVLGEGYRPVDFGVSLAQAGSPFHPDFKVDPAGPTKLLQVPTPRLLQEVRELWIQTKKPANIYLVVDTSGSMAGSKLDGVKQALASFVDQVQGNRYQVGLIEFNDDVREVKALAPFDARVQSSLRAEIRALKPGGGTALYDAVAVTIGQLERLGDPKRINVIVAMTDGRSQGDIQVLESRIRSANLPVIIFTVAYGDDVDLGVLRRIARLGNGRVYASDPQTIEKLFELLSAFF